MIVNVNHSARLMQEEVENLVFSAIIIFSVVVVMCYVSHLCCILIIEEIVHILTRRHWRFLDMDNCVSCHICNATMHLYSRISFSEFCMLQKLPT